MHKHNTQTRSLPSLSPFASKNHTSNNISSTSSGRVVQSPLATTGVADRRCARHHQRIDNNNGQVRQGQQAQACRFEEAVSLLVQLDNSASCCAARARAFVPRVCVACGDVSQRTRLRVCGPTARSVRHSVLCVMQQRVYCARLSVLRRRWQRCWRARRAASRAGNIFAGVRVARVCVRRAACVAPPGSACVARNVVHASRPNDRVRCCAAAERVSAPKKTPPLLTR